MFAYDDTCAYICARFWYTNFLFTKPIHMRGFFMRLFALIAFAFVCGVGYAQTAQPAAPTDVGVEFVVSVTCSDICDDVAPFAVTPVLIETATKTADTNAATTAPAPTYLHTADPALPTTSGDCDGHSQDNATDILSGSSGGNPRG